MIYQQEDNSFERFQNLLRAINYPDIPDKPEKTWVVNSYDLCQNYLKERRITPAVLELVSKFVPIEKYYWSSVVSFPSLYLMYKDENGIKEFSYLNKEELEHFENRIKEMVETVYKNQKEACFALEDNYTDVVNNVVNWFVELKERKEKIAKEKDLE